MTDQWNQDQQYTPHGNASQAPWERIYDTGQPNDEWLNDYDFDPHPCDKTFDLIWGGVGTGKTTSVTDIITHKRKVECLFLTPLRVHKYELMRADFDVFCFKLLQCKKPDYKGGGVLYIDEIVTILGQLFSKVGKGCFWKCKRDVIDAVDRLVQLVKEHPVRVLEATMTAAAAKFLRWIAMCAGKKLSIRRHNRLSLTQHFDVFYNVADALKSLRPHESCIVLLDRKGDGAAYGLDKVIDADDHEDQEKLLRGEFKGMRIGVTSWAVAGLNFMHEDWVFIVVLSHSFLKPSANCQFLGRNRKGTRAIIVDNGKDDWNRQMQPIPKTSGGFIDNALLEVKQLWDMEGAFPFKELMLLLECNFNMTVKDHVHSVLHTKRPKLLDIAPAAVDAVLNDTPDEVLRKDVKRLKHILAGTKVRDEVVLLALARCSNIEAAFELNDLVRENKTESWWLNEAKTCPIRGLGLENNEDDVLLGDRMYRSVWTYKELGITKAHARQIASMFGGFIEQVHNDKHNKYFTLRLPLVTCRDTMYTDGPAAEYAIWTTLQRGIEPLPERPLPTGQRIELVADVALEHSLRSDILIETLWAERLRSECTDENGLIDDAKARALYERLKAQKEEARSPYASPSYLRIKSIAQSM